MSDEGAKSEDQPVTFYSLKLTKLLESKQAAGSAAKGILSLTCAGALAGQWPRCRQEGTTGARREGCSRQTASHAIRSNPERVTGN